MKSPLPKGKKEDCKPEAGRLQPIINLSKCEGKGPCIEVCPYDVFEMQKIDDAQFAELTWVGKLKTRFNGRDKAVVVQPDACHSCGLCVTACPEKAIKLGRAGS